MKQQTFGLIKLFHSGYRGKINYDCEIFSWTQSFYNNLQKLKKS